MCIWCFIQKVAAGPSKLAAVKAKTPVIAESSDAEVAKDANTIDNNAVVNTAVAAVVNTAETGSSSQHYRGSSSQHSNSQHCRGSSSQDYRSSSSNWRHMLNTIGDV
jgi:hypothetical protein